VVKAETVTTSTLLTFFPDWWSRRPEASLSLGKMKKRNTRRSWRSEPAGWRSEYRLSVSRAPGK